jgi:uncharacterized membrane protein
MNTSALGRLFFAISIVAFGVQQLMTGGFVRLVPPLPAWIPSPSSWASVVGAVLIFAGVAIGMGVRVRQALAVLGALLLLAILFLHLPQVAANPLVGFVWTNPFKALAMLGGVIILAGALPERDAGTFLARLFETARPLGPLLLGAFLLLGGVQHFVYADFVAQLVPAWISPGQRFWVYLTGVALIAGGVGIMLPKTRRLTALMSGLMIFLWVVLLHVPRALTDLSNAGETSGVFEALALSGVAFILAMSPAWSTHQGKRSSESF